MLTISPNGTVTLARGDSFYCTLYINQGTKLSPSRYELTNHENDFVYLALCEPNQPFECALVKKAFNYEDVNELGDVEIYFSPEDTEQLLPGKYYYQVKLRMAKGNDRYEVNTIIPSTPFYIE